MTEMWANDFVPRSARADELEDPLITAAQFLTTQLSWLQHATDEQGEAVAVDVFREISECAARMRSIVEGPREQKYLGPCGAEIVDDDPPDDAFAGCPNHGRCLATWDCHAGNCKPVPPPTCDGDVYGIPGAEKGRCKACGATVDQDQRRAWLDAEVRQYAYTAREIAEAYGLKANTIRQWLSRGLLVQHGELAGRPLLLLGEVLDLAAGDAARREEARAARARRREGATA